MVTFTYSANDSKGQYFRGTMLAENKTDVAKKLQRKGLFLVSCRPEVEAPPAPPTHANESVAVATPNVASAGPISAAPTSKPEIKLDFWRRWVDRFKHPDPKIEPKGEVSLQELVVFTRQIAVSIKAGMSLVEALEGLASNSNNLRLAWVMRRIAEDIIAGKTFSDALANHPTIFRPVYISMAASGEAGGFIPQALARTVVFLEKEIALRANIKSAMVYPTVVASIATVVVTGMMWFIVPTFVKVFQDMHAQLPMPTRLLIHLSDFVRHGGFMTPLALVGIILGLRRLRSRNERYRALWDKIVLELPVFGRIVRLEIISRFMQTLASLVGNGVAALQAIRIARQVVDNRSIEAVVDQISDSVQSGQGISPALRNSKYFPPLVTNMVTTGEKTGTIPQVLSQMADYYDTEVSIAIRDLLTMLEPMLLVAMAVVVGFIITGLMLPSFQMSSLVQ